MDPASLAATVVPLLAPFLPKLMEGLAGEAAKGVGEGVKALWAKLHPAIESKPAALEAAQDAAAAPDNAPRQGALQVQLEKLFAADPALASAVAEMVERERPAAGSTVITQMAGDHAFQVGQARDLKVDRGR